MWSNPPLIFIRQLAAMAHVKALLSHILFIVIFDCLPLFKVCKNLVGLSSSRWLMTDKLMDWLPNDENLATAIVIAGYGLFTVAVYLLART
jgi:hypothetical protein